jgi:MFS family permease
MSITKKISEFLGLNKSIGTMLIMVILLGLGEKMGERFLPIYLIAIGGSAYAVGLLNALDNFLSAIYSWVGGFVSDWLGYKKALMVYSMVAVLGYSIVIIFPYWQAVLFGAIFFISWTALSLPAILSLVSSTLKKEKHTMGVSIHSMIRRIPMALGPIFGSLLINSFGIVNGTRMAFSVALVLAFLSQLFIHLFIHEEKKKTDLVPNPIDSLKSMPNELRVLLLSDIFIRFAEQIPYAFVVLWVMNIQGFSAIQFSFLTMIEMLVALLIYIPVAYLSESIHHKYLIVITFIFFSIFPLVLLFSINFNLLILAFIIRGLKEFGEPTRKALIVRLAPTNHKASTFGTYYLFRDTVVSIVSLSSAFLWLISPQVNFITASILGFIGTIIFIVFGKTELENDSV